MTILTNTALTFGAVGLREDLSDMIFNISPVDCPFISRIKSATAEAVLHEWQTDALADAAANAKLEGDDPTITNSFSAATDTARVSNRCQISYKTCVVSGTLDSVKKAGRNKEIVKQMAMRAKELKRDMEFICTNNQAPVTGDATTARQLRPLVSWYTTSGNISANGGSNGSSSAARTDGTQRALVESYVKTVLQGCWTQGGEPNLIMCGPFNKTVISGFTGNATRMDQSEDKKLVAAIDIYESDFGQHKIVANRFQRARDVHVIDTKMWAVAYLTGRKFQTLDLAKTGDAEKGMVLSEYTLEARNQASSGLVADLTTS